MTAMGELYDGRKMIPYIMKLKAVDRKRATEIFNKFKENENRRIPNVTDFMEKIWEEEDAKGQLNEGESK